MELPAAFRAGQIGYHIERKEDAMKTLFDILIPTVATGCACGIGAMIFLAFTGG